MTREELKEHCKKQVEMCEMWAIAKGEQPHGRIYEEHKLILELLEQEPCKDVISRQEVLKYFEGWKNQVKYYHPYAKNFDIPYEEAIQKIKDVPPVKCVSLEKPNICEDAISRQAVLSKIKEVCFSEEWASFRVDNGSNGQRDFLINYIEQLQPVNQQEPCSNCCNGNQIEKAKLCQKSYLAGMEHKQEQCADAISRRAVLDKLNRLIEVERLQGTDEMGYGRERVSAYESMIFEIESEYLYPSVSSSENPNKCEDAISRQMVLDATVNKNSIWNNITNAKGENLEEIILQLPSVNQLNKWIGAEVLDEIRAEIENKYESISDTYHHYETGFTDALEWALSLIDKHIEGSEGKNEVN